MVQNKQQHAQTQFVSAGLVSCFFFRSQKNFRDTLSGFWSLNIRASLLMSAWLESGKTNNGQLPISLPTRPVGPFWVVVALSWLGLARFGSSSEPGQKFAEERTTLSWTFLLYTIIDFCQPFAVDKMLFDYRIPVQS